jgi:hypothetical protein
MAHAEAAQVGDWAEAVQVRNGSTTMTTKRFDVWLAGQNKEPV